MSFLSEISTQCCQPCARGRRCKVPVKTSLAAVRNAALLIAMLTMGFMLLPTTRAQLDDELPDTANFNGTATVPNRSEDVDIFGINPRASETPHKERSDTAKAKEDVTPVSPVISPLNEQPDGATDTVPPADDESSQDESDFLFIDYDDESIYWG